MTSQNIRLLYDRHCGIMCGVKGRRVIVLFTYHSIRWFMKMSVWSLACQQSVFQRYHSEKHLWEFYPQDGDESQLASKLRHCDPMYRGSKTYTWVIWVTVEILDVTMDHKVNSCPLTQVWRRSDDSTQSWRLWAVNRFNSVATTALAKW